MDFKRVDMTKKKKEEFSKNKLVTKQIHSLNEHYHTLTNIYIVIHKQTVWLYYNSSVWLRVRPARCFTVGSKPSWFYVCQTSYPKAIFILGVSEGIFYIYIFTYTLSANWSANDNTGMFIKIYLKILKTEMKNKFDKNIFSLYNLVKIHSGSLVGWILWHINLCRLFKAKSIFIQIISSISNN